MARLSRVVIPGHPHHVTQRGIGRPIGDKAFLDRIAQLSSRRLEPGKRDPKPELNALSP